MTVELDPAQQATTSPENSGAFIIADVMAPGHMIEKAPVPMARIAMAVPSAESVLNAIDDESGQFVPYVFEGSATPEEQTDTSLTDEERLDLAGILGNGGAIRVLGYSNETSTADNTAPEQPEQKDDEGGLMTALRKTRVATAASTIGIAAAGVISMFGASTAKADTVPVRAGNVPTLADGQSPFSDYESTSSTTSIAADAEDASTGVSLTPAELQECVKIATSGLVKDPGNGLTMYHAGIRLNTPGINRNEHEDVVGSRVLQPMPNGSEPGEPNCGDIYRAAKSRLQMESPQQPGRFMLLDKEPAFPVQSNRSGIPEIEIRWGAVGSDFIFNQCVGGKHWLKVRDEETLIARDAQTHKLLGTHTYDWPVKVEGSCAAAARSARLVNGFGVRK